MERFIEQKLFSRQRNKLIESLRERVSDDTLEAMSQIPRHRFVSPPLLTLAYADKPLPIMKFPSWKTPLHLLKHDGKTTISQPFTVGLMTDLLSLKSTDRVLEIGTATGYQAAILSKLAASVVTVDIHEDLVRSAKKRLDGLGIENIETLVADGSILFSSKGSFDKIIVTASVPPMPPHHPLLELLSENGTAVMPLGGFQGEKDDCEMLVIRSKNGSYEIQQQIPGFSFVTMEGRAGWKSFNAAVMYAFHEKLIENLGGDSKE